jgi:uncharacterized membrane protein YfcA
MAYVSPINENANWIDVMEWYYYPIVIAAGFACGVINILAGSGSLISLPILIFIGLPINVANGTNRVAILLQNIVGVSRFRQNKMLSFRKNLYLMIPAALGAIVGAQIAVNLDERMMRLTIGGLMIVMLISLLIRPKRWLDGRAEGEKKSADWLQYLVFFGIGIYGGFIQAGVGIFLLAGLVLSAGYDLKLANPVKLLIILFFTIFALAVFVYHGQVRWGIGLVMALGNMLGALVGTKLAITRGAGFIRYILIAILIVTAVKLFGGFEYLGKIL